MLTPVADSERACLYSSRLHIHLVCYFEKYKAKQCTPAPMKLKHTNTRAQNAQVTMWNKSSSFQTREKKIRASFVSYVHFFSSFSFVHSLLLFGRMPFCTLSNLSLCQKWWSIWEMPTKATTTRTASPFVPVLFCSTSFISVFSPFMVWSHVQIPASFDHVRLTRLSADAVLKNLKKEVAASVSFHVVFILA